MTRLLPLFALAACGAHAVPKSVALEVTKPRAAAPRTLPAQLRVVTFNTHMVPGHVVLAGLRGDPALRDADLIMLEEVHRHELGDSPCSAACSAAHELGYSAVYAPGHSHGDGSDGVALLSRAPILSAEVIELPYFNVHVNAGRRVAIAAKVKIGNVVTTVYAVHLDNRLDVADRRAQMLPVLEHAKAQTTPVIIAGDFNTSPFTWVAHVIPVPTGTQDDRFEALVRSYGLDTPSRGSGPTSRVLGMKLDALYTRGFATLETATARAMDVSDHLALWATMQASEPE